MGALTETSVNPEEVANFEAQAQSWWDPSGPFKPLHLLNPARLMFIRQHIVNNFALNDQSPTPLEGVRLLDVGCGGGLLCEPLTRLGATVTGVDAGEETLHVARLHAAQQNLTIDYRHGTAEMLASAQEQYHVVTAMEIVEHVDDLPTFLKACCQLVRPGGLLIASTLNRTLRSYAVAIVGAEYVMGWVPKGTHDWKKFLSPAELSAPLRHNGMLITDMKGITFKPMARAWTLSDDLSINYMIASKKGAFSQTV